MGVCSTKNIGNEKRRCDELLNILFWNLKRNAIEDYIIDCIVENNVDIAVFSEFNGINFINIEKNLGKMYGRILAAQDDRKVTLIAKNTFSVTILQQQNRYSIYNVKTAVKDYLLAAVHLEDRRNYKSAERIDTIKRLVADIEQTEELLKCNNTIVIGDLNANPYDEELLSKYAFNAVLFKTIIDKSELTNPNSSKRKRFYNPILHYISEDTEMYGSFYHEKDYMTSYWHCLDQVLVRKSLVNSVNC
ncbi:hypothetical protein [Ruminococcus sp. 5_1_39BFAA]|uniref:hypothetical protein n=1 Tax=Ruminococcus sp. 5_1_39BFAA TaxID=457412 RepID=UPI003563DFDA